MVKESSLISLRLTVTARPVNPPIDPLTRQEEMVGLALATKLLMELRIQTVSVSAVHAILAHADNHINERLNAMLRGIE